MTLSPPQAYLNGVFIPASQLALPLNDQGCRWGVIVTERLRTYQRVPYRMEHHLARFRESCRLAHIPLTKSEHRLEKVIGKLLVKNDVGTEVMVVLLATPGRPGGPPTFIAHLEQLDRIRYARTVTEGAVLRTASIRQAPPDHVPLAMKQRSRLFWWLAEQEVKASDPEAMALLLDHSGRLTETAYANVLLILDGQVISPPRNRILPGTRLGLIEELCESIGIKFLERELSLDNARWASEALVASTPFGFAPVRQLNEFQYPVPGPVFTALHQAWVRALGFDPQAELHDGGQGTAA